VVTEGTKSYIFILDESVEAAKHEGHEHLAVAAEEGHEHEAEELHASHDHEAEENHEKHAGEAGHEDEDGSHTMAFSMVEVITGMQESGYTEIKLLSPLPDDTQIVMNAAYYLLADLKKEETGDDD
jgi:cobalt-zinc-cadmium efflux system membrane fusion protein